MRGLEPVLVGCAAIRAFNREFRDPAAGRIERPNGAAVPVRGREIKIGAADVGYGHVIEAIDGLVQHGPELGGCSQAV
ncbi:MAG: hypothetical protein HY370_08180 [Proteobacteria bacterium]|nr:hypothetical protein [Pseudomonadota bacterium]